MEVRQSREEGKDVSGVEKIAKVIFESSKIPQRELAAGSIFDRLAQEPVIESFRYVEPSDLRSIQKARPKLETPKHFLFEPEPQSRWQDRRTRNRWATVVERRWRKGNSVAAIALAGEWHRGTFPTA